MALDPVYVSNVLIDNFRDAKVLFLGPLISIHYAHLVMLAERGIISASHAKQLREGLDAISIPALEEMSFDGTSEDLFFHVEQRLTAACGEDVAGRLHTARSRNDIDMTMYRMRLRDFILTTSDAVNGLRGVLLELAQRHRESVFPAHTHTQPAQPTTIAHYLLAVAEQLERDARRLSAAYAATNRCPLGACAITGTGFPIDRTLTSDLLGFDGPTGNTYGSIATVDYLLESVSAVTVMLVGLGRVVQDLLLWCTAELAYLRLADGFVQCSSIMPQKRNPVALEHARALASKAVGQAHAVTTTVHNTPFGDIVDTEDDLQPLVASVFRDGQRAVSLLAAALRAATFDTARLERHAADGGTTLTELADQLVRDHGLPFRQAHAITTRMLPALRAGGGSSGLGIALDDAARQVLGAPLHYDDDRLVSMLSPRHFVEVRTTWGGPAPAETDRAAATANHSLEADREWVRETRRAIDAAADRLRERAAAL